MIQVLSTGYVPVDRDIFIIKHNGIIIISIMMISKFNGILCILVDLLLNELIMSTTSSSDMYVRYYKVKLISVFKKCSR